MHTTRPSGRSSTDRHQLDQPLGEQAGAGIVRRPVDHLDRRPPPPLDGPVGGDQVPSLGHRHRRARRDQHHRGAVPTAPLDHHVHRRPGRRALLPVGLVVGVEDHGGPQPVRSGPRPRPGCRPPRRRRLAARSHMSGSRATGDARLAGAGGQLLGPARATGPAPGRRPGPTGGRARAPPAWRPGPGPAGPPRSRPARPGRRRRWPPSRRRATAAVLRGRDDGRASVADGGRRRPRTTRLGEAVPRNEDSGPAHRHAAHSASDTTDGRRARPRSRRPGAWPSPRASGPRRPRPPSRRPAGRGGRCGPGCPHRPPPPGRGGTG